MVKVLLTPIQKEIVDLYVKEGLTQEEIAIKVYGTKHKQGMVSKHLISVSKRLGINLTTRYSKNGNYQEYDIEV